MSNRATPHCTCYKATGRKTNIHDKSRPTRCSDGETCDFCEYYVTWVVEDMPKKHVKFDNYKHWEDYEDMDL